MKKLLSVLTVLFLLAALPAQAMNDNPTGVIVEEVPAGDKMANNSGTVDTNNGTIETNNSQGAIATNNGTVETNNGSVNINNDTVITNNCVVITNNGTVETNNSAVITNEGAVETNNGAVETNNGTVITNNSAVETNNGTVETNGSTGSINSNNGTVDTNNGTVDTNNGTVETNGSTGSINSNNGTVDTNNGTVDTNNGTVETNGSTGNINDNNGTVETNNGHIKVNQINFTVNTNNGTINYNGGTVKINGNDGVITNNDSIVEINNGKVTNTDELGGGKVKTNNGTVYNGVYNADQDAIVYTAESIANFVIRFINADGEEYSRVNKEAAYDTETLAITAQDISLPETSKSGYRGKWVSDTLSGYAGSTLTGVDKAMVFNLIWEKLASEKTTETTQTVETAEATRAADSHDISVSNTFFFMRKPQNFRGITLNGEALVEDEDFTLTAVARNESDTENTATQIDFTEAFFEKYGEDPLEITLNFVDMEYTLTVTNLADLIQIYEA